MSGKEKEALVDHTGRASADPKHAAVVLPAGSFDVEELASKLNAATRAAADKREGVVADALKAAAGEGTVLEQADGAAQPGDKIVEVEHDELGVKEQLRVFDLKEAKAEGVATDVEQKG